MIKTFDQAEKIINIVNKFCHVLEDIITNNADAILPTKIIKNRDLLNRKSLLRLLIAHTTCDM